MDEFVERNREEIEKEAYRIYEIRKEFYHTNNPVSNFLSAIAIVKAKHEQKKGKVEAC